MRLALSTVALVACTSLASAADLGGPYGYDGSIKDGPIAAAAPIWSGFYVGAHGGWAGGSGWSGDFVWMDVDLNRSYSLDAEGWYGGIQLGVNKQFGNWVAGIEADASFGDLGESGMFPANHVVGDSYVEWEIKQKLERFGTVRARLGYLPADHLLVYATGGMAWGQTEASQLIHYVNRNPIETMGYGNADETHFGWTLGGGFEWALSSRLSLKGEYLYVDLGDENYHFIGKKGIPPTAYNDEDSAPSDLDFHTVRLGLNYKFGR